MQKRKKIFIGILVLVLLAGCEQPKVIDDIRLVQAVGYDYYTEKAVLGTITTPIYAHTGGSGQVQARTDAYSVIGHKGRELESLLEARSEHPLQLGKLLIVIFGKRLAAEGIYGFIDLLNRNPDVGRTLDVAVVDGKAEDILNGHYESDPLVSLYISDLVNHLTLNSFPTTNLHEFLYSYFGDGMDPFLPLLKKKQKHVEVKGIALFKDDKYVSFIPYSHAYTFKMLYEPFRGGDYSIPWDKKHYLSIMNITSQVKYDVKVNPSSPPEVTIHVKEKGYLRETNAYMSPKRHLDEIQKKMKKSLQKEGIEIIHQLQKLKVDPLRIGDHVRSFDPNWTAKKWEDEYPNIDIKLDVKVQLNQTGITE